MKYFVSTMVVVFLAIPAISAHAAPIQVCIYNRNNAPVWVSLRFPGGGISNFSMPPNSVERRQGDSAGAACSAFQPFTNSECPNPRSQNDYRCD